MYQPHDAGKRDSASDVIDALREPPASAVFLLVHRADCGQQPAAEIFSAFELASMKWARSCGCHELNLPTVYAVTPLCIDEVDAEKRLILEELANGY